MKMTMHIDEVLLNRVIEHYEFASKTEAVEMALRELDRKSRFKSIGKKGMGSTPAELIAAIDPDYDLNIMRVAETPSKNAR